MNGEKRHILRHGGWSSKAIIWPERKASSSCSRQLQILEEQRWWKDDELVRKVKREVVVSYLEGLKDPCWVKTHLLDIDVMELFLMFVGKKGMKSFSLSNGKKPSFSPGQTERDGWGGIFIELESQLKEMEPSMSHRCFWLKLSLPPCLPSFLIFFLLDLKFVLSVCLGKQWLYKLFLSKQVIYP